MQRLFLILFSCIFLTTNAQELSTTPAFDKKKKNILLISEGVAYTATLIGLNSLWYKDYPRSSFHFINDNTGEFLLLAEESWFITTKSDIDEVPFTLRGMHGYDPALQSMHGIFYAVGASIKEGMQIPAFENIHIYPLICRLLN